MASWFDRPSDLRDGVAASNQRYGTRLAFWPREEVQNVCSSPRYYDGIFNPDGFQFHPLNYTRGIARAADRLGAQIFEASPVTSIRRTGDHIDVGTSRGSVRCKTVVVCCSGYIGGLVPRLSRATLPVGTYVLLTKPLGADLEEAIRTQYAVADDRMAQDYYRPLEDGRLLWGGRISTELSPARLAELMLVQIERVYPQLKGRVVPDVAWPGTMGYATHKMPQIGELEPGFWYAQGFGGHGMNTTAMAGDLIASALVDGDTLAALFRFRPHLRRRHFGRPLPKPSIGPIRCVIGSFLSDRPSSFRVTRPIPLSVSGCPFRRMHWACPTSSPSVSPASAR